MPCHLSDGREKRVFYRGFLEGLDLGDNSKTLGLIWELWRFQKASKRHHEKKLCIVTVPTWKSFPSATLRYLARLLMLSNMYHAYKLVGGRSGTGLYLSTTEAIHECQPFVFWSTRIRQAHLDLLTDIPTAFHSFSTSSKRLWSIFPTK